MASSYALPSSPLPHAHRNPLHSHSSSHSPPAMRSFRGPMSSGSLHSHSQSETHTRQNGHMHTRFQSQAEPIRERMPPAPITVPEGWREESTPGGRKLLTPAATTTSFPAPYQPPHYSEDRHDHDHDHVHDHGHDHQHDHGQNHHGHHEHHSHDDHSHTHSHAHGHGHGHTHERSAVTGFLLKYTASWPFLHAIMTEKDSRRILYYLILNVSFMLVQAFYGYVTDSLGLLSDTVHMFFDCVALLVGLVAAVVSKWPPSQRFPYGLGKMETLSGFANGILLILLSVEITFEAFERLYEGSKPKRLGELLIVSILGMLVNLIGMFAFGHHHHGHGHDHGHSHGHTHEHSHDEKSGHSHHGHSHDNDNMHGIYLHVLADTLGSASVVVSTILTGIWGWAGWDPLASVFISVLILLSSKPLVMSSAKRLLLGIPDDIEYNMRNVLAGISQQPGVVGCAVPKFWIDDRSGGDAGDRLLGIVHVVAARGASLDEVRDRVRFFLLKNGMDITVQVEREGDGSCWCGSGRPPMTPMTPRAPKAF